MKFQKTVFHIQNRLRNLRQIGLARLGEECVRDKSCSESKYQEFTVISLDDNSDLQQKCIYSGDYKYTFNILPGQDPADSCQSSISVTIDITNNCRPVGNPTALLLCSEKCYVWQAPDANWLALNYTASEQTLSVAVTCDPSQDGCVLQTENGLTCNKKYG